MAQQSPFFAFLGTFPAEHSALIDQRIAAAAGSSLLEAASWTSGRATLGSKEADAAQKAFYSTVPQLTTRAERVTAAKAALAVGPCADAHVLLAGEEAKDLAEAQVHVDEAMRISQLNMTDVPSWDSLPTRPYIRALHANASLLLAQKQPEKVIALLSKLPVVAADPLGLQLILVLAYLRRTPANSEAARRVIDARVSRTAPGGSMLSAWLWTAAYQAEEASHASHDSTSALATALKSNGHVTYFILQRRALTPVPPLVAAEGSEAEAEVIMHGLRCVP